ncbi:MAG: YSC84-related protein [Luteolibacter sp.]
MHAILSRLAIAAAAATCALLSSCATNDPVTLTNAANTSATQLTRESRAALSSLYSQNAGAKALGRKARAIVVFPSVTRAGFVFGGQAGNGTMFRNDGSVAGHFQTTSASWGLQAGVQNFGYALFLMDDGAIRNINRNGGWEIGSSPSLVVVDRGMAGSLSTTSLNRGTYAVFFDQRGLMAGLGLQGSKITRIQPGR